MGDDLLTRSALELAALVRAGELSARELIEASLAAIEAANANVNAFVHVDAEGALAAADAIGPGDKRPFAGVPFGLKDLHPAVGLPMTQGSGVFGDFRPGFDDNVSARLRGAGFVFVGVTNMPELGITATTEPRRYGATRNPWDLTRTPGGSSGGSAAAVAAGMVPVAHANDGGGSIRIPASCCGLVGLKPARGRVSLAPLLGQAPLLGEGVVTRSVAETAAILDVLAGPVTGDASWAPLPPEPFAQAAAREPGRLRIGITARPATAADVDPACERAVLEAGRLLEGLGHEVEELDPPWPIDGLFEGFADVFSSMLASVLVQVGAARGRPVEHDEVESLTWAVLERAHSLDAPAFLAASTMLDGFARQIVTATDAYDAVLTPTLAEAPVPLGTIDADAADPWEAGFARAARFAPYPAIANVTGQPAISLPLFEHPGGLPLGVQLVGRPADEITLLQLATQLEAARPWAGRLSPVALGGSAG